MNKTRALHATRGSNGGAASPAKDGADGASQVADSLDAATTSVGRGVDRAGAMIQSTGDSAGAAVRSGGRYLQEADPATMLADFRATLGRHPGPTLAIGIGAGILLGRLFGSHRS